MADKTDRGTHDDPAWKAVNLTGGNDSGTAPMGSGRLDPADGPDLTARITESEGGSVAGSATDFQRASHTERRDSPGTPSHGGTDDQEVTDESGRIAPAEDAPNGSQTGGARDPRVTGMDGDEI
jgi:hypothetical protein